MIAFIGYCVLALMFMAYVLSDGCDLGVAAIAPLVGKSRREVDAILESIGPCWNANEVWLVAAGGTLFALFPRAYASAFSLFYLALIFVLWLLIGRGVGMELRGHLPSGLWKGFWTVTASISSTVLILLLGVALGNLVRGLTLNGSGFLLGSLTLLLNPYALLVGAMAVLALIEHGLTYIAARSDGDLSGRASRYAANFWWVLLAGYSAVTFATIALHPSGRPGTSVAALSGFVALLSLIALRVSIGRRHVKSAFRCSSIFVASMVGAAAATMFPYILPSYGSAANGMSAFEVLSPSATTAACLLIGIIGIVIAMVCGRFVRRHMTENIRLGAEPYE